MDISNYSRYNHAESTGYINADAPGKHVRSLIRHASGNQDVSIPSEKQARDLESYGDDQRQDVACRVQPEHEPSQRRRWNDLATTVSSLSEFVCAPCFVNTSVSMDHESPAYSTVSTLPANNTGMAMRANTGDDELMDSSIHSTSVPLISFPSLHFDSDIWGDPENEDDSAYFQTPKRNLMLNCFQGLPSKPQPIQQPSIYRASNKVAAADGLRNPFQSANSLWPAVPAGETPFGLHRSLAWSDDHDDHSEDGVVSLPDDGGGDDWEKLVPAHNPNFSRIQTDDGSYKSVIDVTEMEDMFSDFEV